VRPSGIYVYTLSLFTILISKKGTFKTRKSKIKSSRTQG